MEGGRLGFARVEVVEFVDKVLRVLEIGDGFPGSFRREISLPMNEVLDIASNKFRVNNLLDLILFFSIDNFRGRWQFVFLGREGGGNIRGEKALIEGGVDSFPGGG